MLSRKDPEFEKQVYSLYVEQGLGCTTIAVMLNSNETRVCRSLKRQGIVVRKADEYRTYKLNEHYFDVIDIQDKAYWLGFITADGAIGRKRLLKVDLNKQDTNHLEKMRLSLETDVPIKPLEKNMVGLRIHSNKLCAGLSRYGVIQNKTFKVKMPVISKELIRHFIRGLFDGDGSIVVTQKHIDFSIATTLEMAEEIQRILIEEVGLNKTKITQVKRTHIVRYGGRLQCRRIRDWLYKDCILYMDRKYEKFNSV